MAQFHPLTVTDIRKTTRDAVVVTLKPVNGGDFSFTQGQYLTFRRTFDGEELRRSYSICAGTSEGVLQVGIKRVAGGAFSTWANTDLAPGDVVEAMLPMGSFYAGDDAEVTHILAFAAGSGITPILSIIKTTLEDSETSRVTLVYGNRNPNTVMFRDELEDLKNVYMGRLNVVHILSDESQEIDLFRGRIDAKKCRSLFTHWIDLASVTRAYICGPEEMMKTVSASLEEHGLAKDRIRFELFASNQPGLAPKRAVDHAAGEAGVAGQVTIGGETRSLMIPQNTSLLEAALAENIDAPFACKGGVCSTCKAKVLEGQVEMVANHALEDYEVDAGFVLTCQSYPVSSEKVVWDYDLSRH
ncbi:2Fe-2S iron-sulfur cluster-binding protein [Aestuariibius sp. 2305UL40-4]|uniref:2Fe-2S iron-sulfur cluster-binding protein n=1 Tax=Aestuariibius violaceus TaxID=3234132 RepID=UPI00345E6E18